jgi:diacylglycerol kinase (ATP)
MIEDRRRPPASNLSNPSPEPQVFVEPPRHTFTHPWSSTFRFAWTGIVYTWRTQRNFRAETYAGILAVSLALLLGVNPASVLLCCALVLSLEMVNTAFEAIVDLASPTYHPLAKIAKDVAAGSVLIASLIAVLVGAASLGPAMWQLVTRLF